jgi:hypothetical protein
MEIEGTYIHIYIYIYIICFGFVKFVEFVVSQVVMLDIYIGGLSEDRK